MRQEQQTTKEKATRWVIENERTALQKELENLMTRISWFERWAEKKGYPCTSRD